MIERVVPLIEGAPQIRRWERIPSGYANANYRLETSAGLYLLRHCVGRDIGEVEFELDVLEWLHRHGFPAPQAHRLADERRWIPGSEESPVVLLQWLDGEEPEPTEQSARVIGETLARLHLLSVPAGNWWRRENPIGRSACAGLVAASGSESVGAFRFFSEEFAELREQLDESLPTGLIHGDVFPDNTLFKDGELVAILDFETTCEDALLFDVAMAIHGFCFPREQWTPGFAEALLAGYGDVRPLEKIEYEALPTYLHWCPLAMMGWHLRELAARRNERNEIRAAQLGDRVTTMKAHPWRP